MSAIILNKRYKVLKTIAGGPRTVIQLVADLGEKNKLKVIKSSIIEESIKGIRQEYSVLSKMTSSPNTVKLFDYWEDENGAHIVLQYLPGKTLDTFLKERQENLTEKEVGYLVGKISEALSSVHSQGILHGDIKPANIKMETGGRICLIDFETACPIGEAVRIQAWTRAYSSPEAWLRQPLDAAHDYYALGIILHEILTGSVLFKKGDVMVKEDVLRKNPPPIPGISDHLNSVICRLVMKDRRRRIQTHNELLSALNELSKNKSDCLYGADQKESQRHTLDFFINALAASLIYLLLSLLFAIWGYSPFAGHLITGLLTGMIMAISGEETCFNKLNSFFCNITFYIILGLFTGVVNHALKTINLPDYIAYLLVAIFLTSGVVIWERLEREEKI